MRTEALTIPPTPRLRRESQRWKASTRPAEIEAPGPGQRSVWDFPRPPAIERVFDRVTVEFADQLIADTRRCLRVLETASPPTYYIPGDDVAMKYLRASAGTTHCEWKGVARYFDLVVGEQVSRHAAWWYPQIREEYALLANHIAFYASRVDRCTVGGEVVEAQPGGFYGGWITSDIVGPWKGSPGSGGW